MILKHAQIVRLLLAHPSFDVSKQNNKCQTVLRMACDMFVHSHVGAQLLLIDNRCDVIFDENVEIQHDDFMNVPSSALFEGDNFAVSGPMVP